MLQDKTGRAAVICKVTDMPGAVKSMHCCPADTDVSQDTDTATSGFALAVGDDTGTVGVFFFDQASLQKQ
eukprot:scaffold89814_cov16-Prasinocladus_malaysianus.AAC.2